MNIINCVYVVLGHEIYVHTYRVQMKKNNKPPCLYIINIIHYYNYYNYYNNYFHVIETDFSLSFKILVFYKESINV